MVYTLNFFFVQNDSILLVALKADHMCTTESMCCQLIPWYSAFAAFSDLALYI